MALSTVTCLRSGFRLCIKCNIGGTFRRGLFSRNCSTNVGDSDLFDNETVQKYLKYIQNKRSSLKCDDSSNSYVHLLSDLLEKQNALHEELGNLGGFNSEGDKELEKLVEEEKKTIMDKLELVRNEIINNLVPVDSVENAVGDTEIHITPGIGGEESKLFLEELYKMYMNYVNYKNYDCLLAELRRDKSDSKSAYILLSGVAPHRLLKHECGVHRVQRVPATEKLGRTHTSTCSVLVYQKAHIKDIDFKSCELVFEAVRSSGPGGQNVNKRETCIKVKHIPTGTMVESQESRYQFQNKKLAMEKLKGLLRESEEKKLTSHKRAFTLEQIGTNDYADKIRTYNFIQNRVTDHRINYTMHNLSGFLMGGKELDQCIQRLDQFRRRESVTNYIQQILKSEEFKSFEKKKLQSPKT